MAGQPSPGVTPAGGQPWSGAAPPLAPAKPRRRALWIAGLVTLALILVVAAVVVVRIVTQPPTPVEVVQSYLDALNAHDAAAALALGNAEPDDLTFLTDAALAQALPQPITDIALTEETPGATTVRVSATYTINGHHGHVSILLVRSEDRWLLSRATRDIDLTTITGYSPWLRLAINGTLLPETVTSVPVFPGEYRFTIPDRPIFGFLDGVNGVTLANPSDTPENLAGKIVIDLTDQGKQLVGQAAQKKLTECLAQTTVAPKECGFGVISETQDGKPLDVGEVTWTQDPATHDIAQLDYHLEGGTFTSARANIEQDPIVLHASTQVNGFNYRADARIYAVRVDIYPSDLMAPMFNPPY